MLNTVMDIETTGFDKVRGTVLSFAYLTLDADFKNVVDGDILYFYQEGQPESDEGAFKVHGLTTDYLKQFENDYTKNLQKLFKIMTKGSIIGYNSGVMNADGGVTGFDIPFVQEFLLRNGYGVVSPFQCFDVMRIYNSVFGRVSLTRLMELLKIPKDGIVTLQKHYYSGRDVKYVSHDATYDVTATLIGFLEARRRGLV